MSYNSTHPAAPPATELPADQNPALLAAITAATRVDDGITRLRIAALRAMGTRGMPRERTTTAALAALFTACGPDVVAAVIREFAPDVKGKR